MFEFLKALNECLTILLDPKHQEVFDSLQNVGKTAKKAISENKPKKKSEDDQ